MKLRIEFWRHNNGGFAFTGGAAIEADSGRAWTDEVQAALLEVSAARDWPKNFEGVATVVDQSAPGEVIKVLAVKSVMKPTLEVR